MRCRGVQGLAKPAFLGGFLGSGLLHVAPFCAPGSVRAVSQWVALILTTLESTQPRPIRRVPHRAHACASCDVGHDGT